MLLSEEIYKQDISNPIVYYRTTDLMQFSSILVQETHRVCSVVFQHRPHT
jgi:hypothetical protein